MLLLKHRLNNFAESECLYIFTPKKCILLEWNGHHQVLGTEVINFYLSKRSFGFSLHVGYFIYLRRAGSNLLLCQQDTVFFVSSSFLITRKYFYLHDVICQNVKFFFGSASNSDLQKSLPPMID